MNTETPSTLRASDLAVDHELAAIALSFRFFLDVTPINGSDARDEFLAGGEQAPTFVYRSLEDDPLIGRSRLEAVAIANVRDATVARLLEAKRQELILQLEMLAARDTVNFRALSVELYGGAGSSLVRQAREILATIDRPDPDDRWLDAVAFADLAEAELAHYRAADPDLSVYVEVREDCSVIMASNGVLLIPASIRVSARRANALLQHEIGTHLLTYVNGAAQPLRLLASGLAGYDRTQEGLALLAEYLVDGLTASRLRQIAARVVAVDSMLADATFRDVHESLVAVGFTPAASFATTMRVFRSGGLTKDAVYLAGLDELLGHLGAGGDLDTLWLGKMPLASAPSVRLLQEQGAIGSAHLLPRYLGAPDAAQRLQALDVPTSIVDLIER